MENVSPVKTAIKAALDQAARCAASKTSENYDGARCPGANARRTISRSPAVETRSRLPVA
jgi:hypothetical protein